MTWLTFWQFFDNFWQVWIFFWQLLKFIDIFDNFFDKFLQFLIIFTILIIFECFLICGKFSDFWGIFQSFWNFLWPETWHLRHWLHFWQLRTTIWTITLWPLNREWWWQHSQFLRCLYVMWDLGCHLGQLKYVNEA